MIETLRSIKFLCIAPFLLAFLFLVNLLVAPGYGWFKWAALGIGLAWIISLIRVIRALVLLGGLAALMSYLRKRSL